jgi:fatty acid desaturase/SAM-dependent methyltransferase
VEYFNVSELVAVKTMSSITINNLTDSVAPKDQMALPAHYAVKSSLFGYFQVAIAFVPLILLQLGIGVLSPLQAVLCAFTAAVVGYRMTIIIHDCSHGTLFLRRIENTIFGKLSAAIMFTNFSLFRRMHWIHHKHFRSKHDPQGSDYNGLVPDRDKVLYHFVKPLFFLNLVEKFTIFNTQTHSGVADEELAHSHTINPKSDVPDLYSSLVLIGMVQLAVLLLTTDMLTRWWGYPLYMVCLISIGLFLSRLRSYLEHGTIEAADADRQIARTHVSNVLERNILSAIYFNYHNEHHRWPQVPSYLLPKLHAQITAGKLPSYDVSPSYWHSFKRIIALSLTGDNTKAPFVGAPVIADQEVDCGLCGSSSHEFYAFSYDYEYQTCENRWQFVRCNDCGNVYLRHRPSLADISVIYPKNYYSYHYESQVNPLALKVKKWMDARTFNAICNTLERRIDAYMDIGCGSGRYLQAMADKGLDKKHIHGFELNNEVADNLSSKGFQVQSCPFEQAVGLKDNSFDLITLFSVLEHMDNPRNVLKRIHDLLSPGGLVVFEVPNIASTNASWFRNRFWGGYHTPRHWNIFSREVVERIAPSLGFSIVNIRMTTGHAFWLWSLHHWIRYGLGYDKIGRWFNPLRCMMGLMVVTPIDLVRTKFSGKTDNMIVFLKKI